MLIHGMDNEWETRLDSSREMGTHSALPQILIANEDEERLPRRYIRRRVPIHGHFRAAK